METYPLFSDGGLIYYLDKSHVSVISVNGIDTVSTWGGEFRHVVKILKTKMPNSFYLNCIEGDEFLDVLIENEFKFDLKYTSLQMYLPLSVSMKDEYIKEILKLNVLDRI